MSRYKRGDPMILTGVIIGVMTFSAVVIFVEKLPKLIKPFIFGHHLITDVFFTAISFSVFPVTGSATLLSASTFCLLFTLYILLRRSAYTWKRILFTHGKFSIEERK
ncbi:MAG: hypothetical protein H8E70_09320 [Candidatus Marinimicrobia bacterium]|nr:hypothetical protein [Candidatus Neomarinimicrobiota bacterium]